jgi:hypothetical protein
MVQKMLHFTVGCILPHSVASNGHGRFMRHLHVVHEINA